jgi:hypothetical protein
MKKVRSKTAVSLCISSTLWNGPQRRQKRISKHLLRRHLSHYVESINVAERYSMRGPWLQGLMFDRMVTTLPELTELLSHALWDR